ncbi:hypothetical protein QA640_07595 [Bradyrhizobium sp. CB82]|uniref:hypothetical protein n=1 Tax=Bradyrhizobium sp. CB82 TaxID=3039159 RepID=UPI0024B25CEE|nr:hypothetical protein [Bradyrhizobium sp. CB82]WFU42321.1 hypothetical protein QA640_07595 [Bradyrhizobium sp. CB82]
MALLDDALDASGGLARWMRLSRFTLHLSFGGMLFTEAGHAGHFTDVIAEGSTRIQSVRFTGMTGGQGCASFQPDSVTIESIDGEILRTWRHPQLRFPNHAIHPLADELHLVFFCGFAIWSYLTTPFLLARPDVQVEELPPWHENGALWHRLRARFPSDIVTHNSEQIFYFDENALQRRVDHDLLGTRVADYSWAHQTFSDIMVPTLRRSQMLRPDGTVIAKPALIDVEIFDAAFD